MRIEFEFIKKRISKSGKCKCGKRLTRSMTFEQTINPFNKNSQGIIKSRLEIRQELEIEAKEWVPEFICSKCKEE